MKAPPSHYLLGHPLPFLKLSKIGLSAVKLSAIRDARVAGIRELHGEELKRLGNLIRQAKRRALLKINENSKTSKLAEVEKLRRGMVRLAARYMQLEGDAETWLPSYSCPDGRGGLSFDPVRFDALGSNLEGYLQHIPSFFSVEWAGDGSLTQSLPRSSHRPVARETKAHDPRVLMRRQILNDAVFLEWVLEIYGTFCDWFPLTRRGRPSGVTPAFGTLVRRVKPKGYTLEVVNHYIPSLNLTEGYLDELLKPCHHAETRKPDSAQTAPNHLPDESTTTQISPLHTLINEIEERLRRKNRVRARGKG